MKLKRILISQPKPETDKSPWYDLITKHKIVLDFKPFIHVEGISAGEFRKQKIDISHYSCIILNSRNAVDHYFRMASELRYSVPEKTKYFCTTEAIALYLQKYIQYRKRKIFFAQQYIEELAEPIKKNKDEKFLFVCSDKATDKTTAYLDVNKINFTQATFYKTVSSDMRQVDVPSYEMIVFFSPNGIQSLFENYPDFKQGNIRIGVFGPGTYTAATLRGLRVDLAAPLPNAPSMTMALDLYIKEFNAKNGEVQPMVNFPSASSTNTNNASNKTVEKPEPLQEKEIKKAAEKKVTPVKKSIAPVKKKAEKKPVNKKPVKKSTAKKKPVAKKITTKKKPAAKKLVKKSIPKSTKKVKPAKVSQATKVKQAKKTVTKKKATVKKVTKPVKKAAKAAKAKSTAKKKPVAKKKR